jgi:hypothetical protein
MRNNVWPARAQKKESSCDPPDSRLIVQRFATRDVKTLRPLAEFPIGSCRSNFNHFLDHRRVFALDSIRSARTRNANASTRETACADIAAAA